MKKLLFIAGLALALLALCAAAEGERFTEGDYEYTYLRNGNLQLEKYLANEETVNIPFSIDGRAVECIAPFAFEGKSFVKVTIPDSVKRICAFAFTDCINVQRIAIPNSVVVIDGNPFPGCRELVNISVRPDHPTLRVTTDGVLYSKNTKTLLCFLSSTQLDSYSVHPGTLALGENAFIGCDSLKQVILPDTLTRIDDGAFYSCANLESIVVPQSVTSIGVGAFSGCEKLKTAVIDAQIINLNEAAFYGCAALTDVSFPDTLMYIGDRAFGACTALERVTLPDSLTTLGNGVFTGCTALESVFFPDALVYIGDRAFYGCEALTGVILSDYTAALGEQVFYGCRKLTQAYLPTSVVRIGEAAFENCSPALYIYTEEYSYAQLYAEVWDISFSFGANNSFLTP